MYLDAANCHQIILRTLMQNVWKNFQDGAIEAVVDINRTVGDLMPGFMQVIKQAVGSIEPF